MKELTKDKRKALSALAFLIEESARLDPNSHMGQLLPKTTKK